MTFRKGQKISPLKKKQKKKHIVCLVCVSDTDEVERLPGPRPAGAELCSCVCPLPDDGLTTAQPSQMLMHIWISDLPADD